MEVVERGKVRGNDCIVFSKPLELPEGTEVLVHIEPVGAEIKKGYTRRCRGFYCSAILRNVG